MKEKKKINGWKLTAIISLIINGLTALLLTIGLASPRSYVKASADFEYSYDSSKIVTSTNNIDSSIDYKLYYNWDVNAVPDTNNFYFTTNPSFRPFGCRLYGVNYVVDGLRLASIDIWSSNGTTIHFGSVIYNGSTSLGQVSLYFYNVDSPYINYNSDSYSSAVHEGFRSLFDGRFSIYNFGGFSSYLANHDFLISYFSQYSVQNLQLAYLQGGYDRVRSYDFQSTFQFYSPTQTNNYSFINNNLIVSSSPLFSNLADVDNGIMLASLGDFLVNGNHFNGLAYYWTRFDFDSYDNIMLDNFLMSSTVTNKYYYYLDCLVPINFSIGHVTWNNINAIAYFHTNVVNHVDDAYGHTENQLRMTSDVLLTSNQLVINKFVTYSVVDSGVTIYNPTISFSALSYLFKVINHFYYNSGSPVITEPYSNDIENSTNNITGVFALITSAFESLIPLLSIMVLPNISLGLLLFIPLILTIILVVIKLVKR